MKMRLFSMHRRESSTHSQAKRRAAYKKRRRENNVAICRVLKYIFNFIKYTCSIAVLVVAAAVGLPVARGASHKWSARTPNVVATPLPILDHNQYKFLGLAVYL